MIAAGGVDGMTVMAVLAFTMRLVRGGASDMGCPRDSSLHLNR